MVFTHPYKGTRQKAPLSGDGGGQPEGKPRQEQEEAGCSCPEAVAAQTLLLFQANVFAQQDSVAWGESFIFNTVAWKLLQLQISSLTYLLGNPEIIPKGYIRREKRSHVRFLQSQT